MFFYILTATFICGKSYPFIVNSPSFKLLTYTHIQLYTLITLSTYEINVYSKNLIIMPSIIQIHHFDTSAGRILFLRN